MIEPDSTEQLQLLATQKRIDQAITTMFALEDDALRYSLNAMLTHGLPAIQISPIQGKLLQLLSFACQATRILEIGSLAGYSGIWLAR